MKPNPAAFPYVLPYEQNPPHFQPGLTKREYFAAMAMSGFLSVPTTMTDVTEYIRSAAKASVIMADALINELNKQQ